MSAQAVEPTLTLREGLERIIATFDAMSPEDRADAFLYVKNPRKYVDVARRARAQAYPERPRLAVVKYRRIPNHATYRNPLRRAAMERRTRPGPRTAGTQPEATRNPPAD